VGPLPPIKIKQSNKVGQSLWEVSIWIVEYLKDNRKEYEQFYKQEFEGKPY